MRSAVEKIDIVLDRELLKAVDRAARSAKQSRSELVREALREHLRRMEIRALEDREREAYRMQPQTRDEKIWEKVAVWPSHFSRSLTSMSGNDEN